MNFIFAEAEVHDPGLFQALGIDLKLLIVQGLAFLVLVWILAKFAYPVIIKSIDDRRDLIEKGIKEAQASQEEMAKTEAKIEAMLGTARQEADEIVARSHQEATAMVAEAETNAKVRAERIVADARTQLEADVTRARETLKKDTMHLVAVATERIIGEKLDAKKDSALIERSLETELV